MDAGHKGCSRIHGQMRPSFVGMQIMEMMRGARGCGKSSATYKFEEYRKITPDILEVQQRWARRQRL